MVFVEVPGSSARAFSVSSSITLCILKHAIACTRPSAARARGGGTYLHTTLWTTFAFIISGLFLQYLSLHSCACLWGPRFFSGVLRCCSYEFPSFVRICRSDARFSVWARDPQGRRGRPMTRGLSEPAPCGESLWGSRTRGSTRAARVVVFFSGW